MTTLFGKKRRRPGRVLMTAEIVLLFVGFICLGWAGYSTGQRLLLGSWQDYRFEQALEGERATLSGFLGYLRSGKANAMHAPEEQPAADMAPPLSTPSRKLEPNELIGRIEISRLKVSAVIREGVDTKTLSRAVGHVPNTALPGQQGNVGVAAHRDTHFRGLRHVRHGDLIRLETLSGTYLYEVDSLKIVWPKNVEVLDPTPEPRLTLVTCYPFSYVGHAPKRFIVQGKQVGFEEKTAHSAGI